MFILNNTYLILITSIHPLIIVNQANALGAGLKWDFELWFGSEIDLGYSKGGQLYPPVSIQWISVDKASHTIHWVVI